PIFRKVTHLISQPRFAFAMFRILPSASSDPTVTSDALAYGLPSRWLGGMGFFQPTGSADMLGERKNRHLYMCRFINFILSMIFSNKTLQITKGVGMVSVDA